MKNKSIYLAFFLLLFSISCADAQERKFKNEHLSLPKLLDSLGLKAKDVSFLIEKKAYKLSVKVGSQVLKEYAVVFGPNPIDDKLRQGDGCTPEGIFKIRSKYPHRSWSKFVWIDYPNADSWKKHKQAKADGIIPQDAKIGGEIGIHGVPAGYDSAIEQKNNWTLGCISLTTGAIKEIYPYFNDNTLIEIRK